MPTRQQKFDCLVRNYRLAASGASRETFLAWERRLVEYVRKNAHRITIASGK